MAKAKYREDASALIASDLIIRICPREGVFYKGTLAQLKADAVVSEDFKAPKGRNTSVWTKDGFYHCLFRCRPPLYKGSYASWIDIDFFQVNVYLSGVDHLVRAHQSRMYDLETRIAAEKFEQSCEGETMRRRAMRAYLDSAFQSFKAKTLEPIA